MVPAGAAWWEVKVDEEIGLPSDCRESCFVWPEPC